MKILTEKKQNFKVERLADIPEGEAISFYRCGDFVDLCRGPHVDNTGDIGAFKLTSIAGSYYRGKDKLRRKENDEILELESEIDFIIEENGVLYDVDCAAGQKTGFVLDQKLNRAAAARIARGRRVQALRNGAYRL